MFILCLSSNDDFIDIFMHYLYGDVIDNRYKVSFALSLPRNFKLYDVIIADEEIILYEQRLMEEENNKKVSNLLTLLYKHSNLIILRNTNNETNYIENKKVTFIDKPINYELLMDHINKIFYEKKHDNYPMLNTRENSNQFTIENILNKISKLEKIISETNNKVVLSYAKGGAYNSNNIISNSEIFLPIQHMKKTEIIHDFLVNVIKDIDIVNKIQIPMELLLNNILTYEQQNYCVHVKLIRENNNLKFQIIVPNNKFINEKQIDILRPYCYDCYLSTNTITMFFNDLLKKDFIKKIWSK